MYRRLSLNKDGGEEQCRSGDMPAPIPSPLFLALEDPEQLKSTCSQ
jgi:hypothetical protein